MAWATVAAFTDNEQVTAAKLNQMADNIEYLRAPNQYEFFDGDGPEMTTTSTSFVSLGANFEQANFACTGRPILVLLQGSVRVTGAGSEIGNFDIEVDGSRIGHTTEGIISIARETNAGSVVTTPPYYASIGSIITGLSSGNHSFKMMWAVDSGGTLRLGYGAAAIRFYVREL
jgi:hypothetical protein